MGSEDDSVPQDRRRSDLPTDLVKEREVFLRSFLQKGVEYTEAFLEESRELREEVVRLRDENAALRAQLASDDAIRDLLKTIERLESERTKLLGRSQDLETREQASKERVSQVEQEFNDLANLYIAAFQLHTSLSVRGVLRSVQDMLGQLVGAQVFLVYVIDGAGKRAVPVAGEGVPEADWVPVDLGVGPVGEACLTGIARVSEQPGQGAGPLAVVPLLIEGRPGGCVEVRELLPQKKDWANLDHQLFHLLTEHAGAALVAANGYDRRAGPAAALAGIEEKLRSPSSSA